MSAREQAREAASNKFDETNDVIESADAASDKWEPILRELRDAIGSYLMWPEDVAPGSGRLPDAYNRASEALRD